MTSQPFKIHRWMRNPRNPVFPPGKSYDCNGCMNPFVIRQDDTYWLFYSGIDET